jgi:hypothetical protein
LLNNVYSILLLGSEDFSSNRTNSSSDGVKQKISRNKSSKINRKSKRTTPRSQSICDIPDVGNWPIPVHLMHNCSTNSTHSTTSARMIICNDNDLSFEVRQLFNSDEEEEIDYLHTLYSLSNSTSVVPDIPAVAIEKLCCWSNQETIFWNRGK